MSRQSPRGVAALMVAVALFIASCAHGTHSRPAAAAPSASRKAEDSGVQSPAPPKMAPAPEGPAQSGAAKPEATFSLPSEWVRVPKEHLKNGHDFAMLSPVSQCMMFGFSTYEIPGPPALYLAFRGESGIKQGFDIGSPVLSDDGSWGMISMKKDDDHISFGMKILPTSPPLAVFVFGRSPVAAAAELDAVMASVLQSLSAAPAPKQ